MWWVCLFWFVGGLGDLGGVFGYSVLDLVVV